MSSFLIKPSSFIRGQIHLPADKSITHRAVILSAISKGKTVIENFSSSKDCLYTINAFRKLGIKIIQKKHKLIIYGKGLRGLKRSKKPIFVGDSGTTIRLLLGVLAGQNFSITLTAGSSLSGRPMRRVIEPLRMMDARIKSKIKIPRHKARHQDWRVRQFLWRNWRVRQKFWRKNLNLRYLSGLMVREIEPSKIEEYSPITIQGGNLKPITYRLPVASAQVKSAILLAALYAKGITTVIEPIKTRDHTERMLKMFGADLKVKGQKISIRKTQGLKPPSYIVVPGDISSASFFIVAAVIVADSSLVIKSVSLNPSRAGLIKVLKRMGVDIKIQSSRFPATKPATKTGGFANSYGEIGGSAKHFGGKIQNYEPMGDLIVKSSTLKGTIISDKEIPSLIDELPILMVAACYARGKTIIESAQELRLKETDRINSMVLGLSKMGADIKVYRKNNREDIIITGAKELKGARVRSFGDHRTAMSLVIAGLKAKGSTLIDDIACVNKSFPNFLDILNSVVH